MKYFDREIKRYAMGVDVIDVTCVARRLGLLVVAMLLVSCRQQSPTILSSTFNICANLPEGASYSYVGPGPDFDVGTLHYNGHEIEVMLGGHPGFTLETRLRGMAAVDGFHMLGRERKDGKDSVLLGMEIGSPRGPMFVRFSSRDLSNAVHMLESSEFLVPCGPAGVARERS